jgi:L-threonylcarbamoyladenylate synthase
VNVANVIDARTADADAVAEEVARVVLKGGLVIFPTDTVYGIGCDPFDTDAIDRIYGAKRRSGSKPLTLHLGSVAEFLEYTRGNPLASIAGKRLFPGAVTLIVRRPAFISEDLTSGLPTLGFRVPDDALARTILERCGPLAATSANTSGEQAYRGDGDWERLPPAELLIENGPTRHRLESSVVDVSGAHARLLREGVVSFEELNERIGPVVRPSMKDRTTTA